MTSIVFTVTDSAQSPARLDTEQVFDIQRLTELKAPESVFNRTYAASMDGKSSKGTLISRHQTSRIGITIPVDELPALDELIDSLADYQIAELDAQDVNYVAAVRQFVMIGQNFPRDKRGCTHISGSFDVRFLD